MTTAMVRCTPPGCDGTIQDGDFRGYQGAYRYTLPDGVPVLAEQESFARLLRRATHQDPGRRFGSASGGRILGCEPNARAVRFGLERTHRAPARLTPDETRRIELVGMANAIRPRTLT
jgi:hypothetical protein